MTDQSVRLRVPAQPQMMLVVRLTTAGVLARSGLTVESMDDVKMAAEEACSCLIRSSGCHDIAIRYQVEPGAFVLEARTGECPDCPACMDGGMGDEEISVVRCVLLSLVDEAEMSFEGGCLRALTLRKRLPM